MGRPASSERLVPLHTLITERQKRELENLARREIVSAGVVLRRILNEKFSRKGE